MAAGISACLIVMLKFIFKLQLVTVKQILLANVITAVGIVSYRVIIRFILTSGVTREYEEKDTDLAQKQKYYFHKIYFNIWNRYNFGDFRRKQKKSFNNRSRRSSKRYNKNIKNQYEKYIQYSRTYR